MQSFMNQKGFATLEVILMVMVIGILATVAVPRFTAIITKANTAKIQSDLATLDTAISMYYMENGTYPTELSQLSAYVRDVDDLKPPTGSAYIKSNNSITATKINATAYAITAGVSGESRATLDSHTAADFTQTSQ